LERISDKMNKFSVTLAARQTPESRFSCFAGTWDELITLCEEAYESTDKRLPAYRDGVLRLLVDPTRFETGITKLQPGQPLFGMFQSRQEGEAPRKALFARGDKVPAQYVEIIIYRDDVLRETPGYEPASEWEIISINASPEPYHVPIPPQTLMCNHFEMDGGTATKMTAEEFEAALRKSLEYWHDKAMCG
jgi:hypothetical protein